MYGSKTIKYIPSRVLHLPLAVAAVLTSYRAKDMDNYFSLAVIAGALSESEDET